MFGGSILLKWERKFRILISEIILAFHKAEYFRRYIFLFPWKDPEHVKSDMPSYLSRPEDPLPNSILPHRCLFSFSVLRRAWLSELQKNSQSHHFWKLWSVLTLDLTDAEKQHWLYVSKSLGHSLDFRWLICDTLFLRYTEMCEKAKKKIWDIMYMLEGYTEIWVKRLGNILLISFGTSLFVFWVLVFPFAKWIFFFALRTSKIFLIRPADFLKMNIHHNSNFKRMWEWNTLIATIFYFQVAKFFFFISKTEIKAAFHIFFSNSL